jgi:hypothetical protein
MQITPKELESVAAVEAPRFDMYSGIHKALRALMADSLVALGRMDSDDAADVAQCTERVRGLLAICAGHVRHENEFVHAAIEARAPGASAAIAHEHQDHVQHITRLAGLVEVLRAAAPEQRAGAATRLYRELALFVADNFQHMHVEETAHNAVLWARYTDAELIAIHDALVAAVPPAEMMAIARWLVPSVNPHERLHLLLDLRAKAPAPAFQAILDTAQPHLTGGEWAKLARGLGLDPVPGLVVG